MSQVQVQFKCESGCEDGCRFVSRCMTCTTSTVPDMVQLAHGLTQVSYSCRCSHQPHFSSLSSCTHTLTLLQHLRQPYHEGFSHADLAG